jgi:hypothetical protein
VSSGTQNGGKRGLAWLAWLRLGGLGWVLGGKKYQVCIYLYTYTGTIIEPIFRVRSFGHGYIRSSLTHSRVVVSHITVSQIPRTRKRYIINIDTRYLDTDDVDDQVSENQKVRSSTHETH